jgi:LysM repeat protein
MSRALLITKLWLLLMVIAVPLMATPASAQSGTVVRVEPSPVFAQVNANLNLSINIENVANLTAFEVHLQFNPAVLEVVQMTNGGFVAADFVAQNVFDNSAGTIDYAVAQMNRPPAQGSGTLLTITFRAKADGSAMVALRSTPAAPSGLLLADQNGAAIQSAWVDGSVTVGATQTPTATATETPTATLSPATVTTTPATSEPATVTATPTPTTTGAPPTEETATPTPTPIVTPVPIGGTLGIHKVRWGETLYCIGRAYQVEPYAIAKANQIRWPNIIFPGQKLTIPNVPWGKIPAGPVCKTQFVVAPGTPAQPTPTPSPDSTIVAPPATPTPVSCRAYHTVRSGETLYRIGVNYGVSYVEIAIVNGIANPRLIYPGQSLCIP